MSGFKNLAELTHIGGKHFRLREPLVFWSDKHQREFVAPAGIITDLASIPWWAQSFCQVLGNNIRSAILHDFNCTEEGKRVNNVSQQLADDLFREGLEVDNERWSKAVVMHRAVTGFQKLKHLFSPVKYHQVPG
jgi:hypothetical protein